MIDQLSVWQIVAIAFGVITIPIVINATWDVAERWRERNRRK